MNGSLAADEADSISRHLEDCPDCRRELRATGAAFEIFGEHLPVETLVGIAFDGSTDPVPRSVAESHLEGCSACLEQLALVRRGRESLKAEEDRPGAARARPDREGRVASFPGRGGDSGPAIWRGVALAASITALVSTAGWFWTWRGGVGPGPAPAAYRGDADPLTAAGTEDRSYPSLRDRLASPGGPRLNVPVVRAEPRALADPDAGAVAEIPIGAESVVLVLDSRLAGDAPVACRLETADGSEIWTRAGLELRPEGGYTLSFSTASLEPGRYTLRVIADPDVTLESYLLSIE